MAVNLLGASDARIDFGDVALLDGLSEVAIAITLLASDYAFGERIVSKWGNTALTEEVFLIWMRSTTQLAWQIIGPSAVSRGIQCSAGVVAAGTLARIVCTWRGSDGLMEIWVNGTKATTTADNFANPGNPATLQSGTTTSLQLGNESDESVDGPDADYSEFAIWNRRIDDAEIQAYGKGYSPSFFPRGLLLYAPLINTSNVRDVWGGVAGSNVAGTTAAHPRMFNKPAPQMRRSHYTAPTAKPWLYRSHTQTLGAGFARGVTA